jgi:hypothetical protein
MLELSCRVATSAWASNRVIIFAVEPKNRENREITAIPTARSAMTGRIAKFSDHG